MNDEERVDGEGDPGPDESFDLEFQKVMSGGYAEFEAQQKVDELKEFRVRILATLDAIHKSSERAIALSTGSAYLTTHDQKAVLDWPHKQGRMRYQELRQWVKLYLIDIAIHYATLHPGEKPVIDYGEVENAMFVGMIEARNAYLLPEGRPHMVSEDGRRLD